jgi:hypothetical protein
VNHQFFGASAIDRPTAVAGVTRARAMACVFGGFALGNVASPARAQAGANIRIAAPPLEAAAQALYAQKMEPGGDRSVSAYADSGKYQDRIRGESRDREARAGQ